MMTEPPSHRSDSRQVAVFGLGYVGCVTAACLSNLGHRVVGVDKDEHKVVSVMSGRAPFFEPGLDDLVTRNISAGRLSATTSAATALANAEIALVCVGTPSGRDGNLSTRYLEAVCYEIRQALTGRCRSLPPLILAVRSTVFPGTCDAVVTPAFDGVEVAVVVHPEFMREGNAVHDFERPPLLVFGGPDRAALQTVAALYRSIDVQPCEVSTRTAEMIKYACNAFHAVKIGFANEVGTLAAALNIDGDEVMRTLCRDTTLNISTAYLKPGLPFGGSCLPKDLRALAYHARHRDLRLSLLESILPSNGEHLRRGILAVLDLPARDRIGVFGLAFKENTDDLRESPVVALLEELVGKGRDVRVFDPHIRLDQIHGANRSFVFAAVPHIARLLDYDLDRMTTWADHLVIAQQPGADCLERIRRSGRPVLDLTRSASQALQTIC